MEVPFETNCRPLSTQGDAVPNGLEPQDSAAFSAKAAAWHENGRNRERERPLEIPERVIRVHLRTALSLTATLIAVFVGLYLLWLTRQIIIWLLIAIFLAVALDPLVAWFQRHGVRSRGLAVLAAIVVVAAALTGIGLLLLPPLITQIGELADSLPKYVDDLTSGRGPLGFLERDYQVVERVRERVEEGGAGGLVVGIAGGALNVAAGVLTAIAAVATITVMVIFLLLGGPRWIEAFYGALPDEAQERWRRVGGDLYRSVGGYVRGNSRSASSPASRPRPCC